MIKRGYLLFSILLTAFILVSCEREVKQISEAEILASYLESADSPLMKDYVNTDMPSMISSDEVKILNDSGKVYIIDIRPAIDFAAGHIVNAHNVQLADILTHIQGVDTTSFTKIAVVCYAGQNSGFAASVLRLMGYDNVFSLKWGMCSWHPDFAGRWKKAISDGNSYAEQFTNEITEKALKGEMPVLSTGKISGQEILNDRVAAVLSEGFSPASVSSQALFNNLSGYYIINYWPADQYANPGHIPGAVQYTPFESIKLEADLKTLPADKPIAVYCSTGQTSAFLVAYLRLLGYNAKSVLYGTNGMIYDKIVTNQMSVFNTGQVKCYPYIHNGK
jgi:rhodanese-related sulfurtransferase